MGPKEESLPSVTVRVATSATLHIRVPGSLFAWVYLSAAQPYAFPDAYPHVLIAACLVRIEEMLRQPEIVFGVDGHEKIAAMSLTGVTALVEFLLDFENVNTADSPDSHKWFRALQIVFSCAVKTISFAKIGTGTGVIPRGVFTHGILVTSDVLTGTFVYVFTCPIICLAKSIVTVAPVATNQVDTGGIWATHIFFFLTLVNI